VYKTESCVFDSQIIVKFLG